MPTNIQPLHQWRDFGQWSVNIGFRLPRRRRFGRQHLADGGIASGDRDDFRERRQHVNGDSISKGRLFVAHVDPIGQ